MSIIALYAPNATDFSTLGLGVLTPTECEVTWKAAGEYELTLTQPIDDTRRWAQLANGCIISAPVPVRESPLYDYSVSKQQAEESVSAVTRNIWRVVRTSTGLYLRTGYGTNHKRLRYYKNGVEVLELDRKTVNGRLWIHCTVLHNGQTGYMSTKYLDLVRTETVGVTEGRPADQKTLKLSQSRFQLFRIYNTEQDTEAGTVTVQARHVFYDLAGNMLNTDYSPNNATGADAVAQMAAGLKNTHDFTFYTDALTSGNVTADYGYRNPVEILLDPDDGVVSQCGCQIIRDNFDVHLIDDQPNDMGVTVRRGKNLVGVTVTNDVSNAVTQIKPCGQDKNGNDFWLSDSEGEDRFVNSAHINDYPTVRTIRKDYDVKLVDKDWDDVTTFRNNASGKAKARAKLRELAEQDFAAGADLPTYGMEVDFVLLQDTEEYQQYAGLQAVHPYDTVAVSDSVINLTAKIRVTGYIWDVLAKQYKDVTLGDLQSVEQTVYSYNLPDAGISGTKIMPNSASGAILRNASIEYAKITVAAIEELNATSITALTARLQELIAGSVTADELYAALANISKATIGSADIDWANIDRLTAVIAQLSQAEIGSADIDWAHIKDLATDTAIITEGVGGQLMISRLAVTEANMVSLTTGELVVKGADGGFYAVSVDADGKIVTTRKQVGNSDVQNLSINAGEKLIEGTVTAACLNATDIFADSAIVRQLIAANLDVDQLFAREIFVNLLRTSRIVGDKSIELIAQQAETNAQAIARQATEFTDAVTRIDGDMESLQNQIDGSIMTWFYPVPPTLANAPAADWTSTEQKNTHLGDLYYDTDTGYCYRWQVQGGAYSWLRITDTDVTKALANAAAAQDTADAKRRVFVNTPVPPYDVGDLWTQGGTGELLRCTTQKISGQSYAAADWVKACKYTDDTVANNALSVAQGGVAGTDVEFYLSTSATALSGGAWQTTAPAWTDGKHMWMRVKTTRKDGMVTTSEPTCIAGATGATGPQGPAGATGATGPQGPQGPKGDAGVGVSSVINYYLATPMASGVTTSTSGWTSGVQNVTSAKKYLWNYEKTSYTDGSSAATTPCIIGAYGDTGATGAAGPQGVGIASIVEHYARSASNSTAPTSWSGTVPALTAAYRYLWNYETVSYTDGSKIDTAKRVIGVYGDTGATGPQGPTGATGATGPQGYSVVASVSRPSFTEALWTTYGTDGHVENWSGTSGIRNGCRIGDIFTVVGTATDSGNAHVLYYRSDTASGDLHGVCIAHSIAKKGDTGAQGPQGVSVTAVTEEYYLSTSKAALAGGSWQASQPAWSLGHYVWTRVKITYSNGSTSYTEPYCDSSWEVANDNAMHAGTEPPAAPVAEGKLWLDQRTEPPVLRRWLGRSVTNAPEFNENLSGAPLIALDPGRVRSFNSLYTGFDPRQPGSGAPSPSNVRPIQAQSAPKLQVSGKNLIPHGSMIGAGQLWTPGEVSGVVEGYGWTHAATNGAVVVFGDIYPCPALKPGQKYTLSFIGWADGAQTISVDCWPDTLPETAFQLTTSPKRYTWTFTSSHPDMDGARIRFYQQLTHAVHITDVQLELGGAATPFEAFRGGLYAAELGRNICGGGVDWLHGYYDEGWKLRTLTGDEGIGAESTNGYQKFYIVDAFSGMISGSNEEKLAAIRCSHFAPDLSPITGSGVDNTVSPVNWNTTVYFNAFAYATPDAFRAYLRAQRAAGTPVQIAYKLAEPVGGWIAPAAPAPVVGMNVLATDGSGITGNYVASGWETVNDPEVILAAQDELRARQLALEADTAGIAAAVLVKPDGVHISRDHRKCETFISDRDFNVVINQKIVSTFAGSYVQIQNMQMRRPAAGGLAFSSVEGVSGISM